MEATRSTFKTPGVTPGSAKTEEENAPSATGAEKPNRLSRKSFKFAGRVIMLVDIASYSVPDDRLLLVSNQSNNLFR